MDALPLDMAMEILGRLLREKVSRATVARIDWGKLGGQFLTFARSPRFAQLVADHAQASDPGVGGSRRDVILAASGDERRLLLEAYLREAVAGVRRRALSSS